MQERRRTPLAVITADPRVCTANTRLERLGQVSLFRDLSAGELQRVDSRCLASGFQAGDLIYREDDSATKLFVVATGVAKAARPTSDGRETILDLYGPGDFLGAVPTLGEDRYADSAWAVTPMCLLTLDDAAFTQILDDLPGVARAALRGISQRLTRAHQAVHLLAGAPLEQRLAAALLFLAEKLGRPWEDAVLLDVPLSREEIAGLTGAAPESVSRVLSAWRKQGLIDSGRRWIAIHDTEKLRSLAGS